jgi:hypothetical protein
MRSYVKVKIGVGAALFFVSPYAYILTYTFLCSIFYISYGTS